MFSRRHEHADDNGVTKRRKRGRRVLAALVMVLPVATLGAVALTESAASASTADAVAAERAYLAQLVRSGDQAGVDNAVAQANQISNACYDRALTDGYEVIASDYCQSYINLYYDGLQFTSDLCRVDYSGCGGLPPGGFPF